MTRLSFLFRWVLKVLFSAGTVILFSVLFIWLRGSLSASVVALLYLVPVLISAALWGIFAGITSSVLSFLFYNYFFIPPYYTLRVAHPQDFLAMLVLLGVAILISSLMARIQGNLRQAQAREKEAILLARLSLDLTNRQDSALIAKALAERLVEFFQNSIVVVEVTQAGQNVRVQLPDGADTAMEPPFCQVPLKSPRGLLGSIRIWMNREDFEPEEERLLQVFASQGAIALDRADLSVTETRARVLEESDKLKTAILSSVSHDLRTPLASIQASATSLLNPAVELEPDARNELETLLLEEINNMIQLVGNLLNMSRIEAGALKLQRQWNSMAEIIDLSIRSLQRFSVNHDVDVDVSEDLPLVSIDSVLMEQVIINLVRNSLRFSPPHTCIRIRASADEQSLRVTVTNEGPPIPEEFISHIFEKFYPIPGKDSSHGTGLGLSICKGVVEAHGGTIWAENLAVGVAFTFTLPLIWKGSHPIIPAEEGEDL